MSKTLALITAAALAVAAPAFAQDSNPGPVGTAGSADGAPASGMNNGATMGSNGAPMDPGMSAPGTSAASTTTGTTTMSHDSMTHSTAKKPMTKRKTTSGKRPTR